MGPVEIALALHHGQSVLGQRHRQRGLRDTGSVGDFRHKQIVTRQQRFLQRARWYHVVLEKKLIDEINGHEGEHEVIDPRHDELHGPLSFLPPLPLDLLRDIDIKDKRYHEESPPTLDPTQEKQIKYQYDNKLCPLYLRIEFFLFYHYR